MMSGRPIAVTLTEKQINKLSKILWDYWDEGPRDEGWSSPELEELRTIIDKLRKARCLT